MPTTLSPARLAHGALLVVGIGVALFDVLAGQFAGPIVANALMLPLPAIAAGLSRASAERAGWRPMLAAADVATVLGAGLLLLRPGFQRFIGVPIPAILAVVLLALVALASLLTALRGEHPTSRIHRTSVHGILLLGLVLLWLGYGVLALGQRPPEAGSDLMGVAAFVAPRAATALTLLATWWLGSPWLIGASAAQTLVAFSALAFGLPMSTSTWLYAAFAVVGIVAAFAGPREVLPDTEAERRSGPLAVATAWLGLGAILYLPTVLWGLFPLGVIVDCFDACPRPIPGAGLLVAITAVSVLVVGATALAYAGGGARKGPTKWLLALSLVAGFLVIVEVALGLGNIAPFAFLPVAGPAAMLVTVGSLAGLIRPSWLSATSGLGAVSAALIGIAWIGTSFLGPGSSPYQVVAIPAAALVAIGIAIESARSGRLAALPATTPTDASVDAQIG